MSRYIAPYDRNLYYAVRHFYYFSITSLYNTQISLTIKDQTYLGATFIALCTDDNLLEGSYGTHGKKLGLRVFGCTSRSLLVQIFG